MSARFLLMNDPSSSSRDRELEALVGRTIGGKYAVQRLLGRGGMGAVYEAENIAIGKKVALKFVDHEYAKDEQVITRFAREARAASSIESAHIVTVFDAGVDEGRPYLVMELLRGEDLGTRLRRTSRVPAAEALHVIAQVLRGLARAHDAGIVHRDLKPDNVFLVKTDGDPSFAKIVDFGVSKIHKAQSGTAPLALTGKGTVLGTPLYMAPEQAQAVADLDGRADLYSVGAILFECIAGCPPHTGASYEQIILSICMTDAPSLRTIDPNVSEPLAAFVSKALARNRDERFASASEMLAGLHEIAPDEKVRVPLDSLPHAPAATMLSAGMAPPGPPTDVSWTRGSRPARGVTPPPAPPSVLARVAIPLTAFAATLAGIVVTLWIVSSMQKHTAPVAAPPTVSNAAVAPPQPSTPAAPPPPAPSAAPPVDPPPSAAPVATAPPAPPPPTRGGARPPPPPPRGGGGSSKPPPPPPPPGTKPLDIARDLPE